MAFLIHSEGFIFFFLAVRHTFFAVEAGNLIVILGDSPLAKEGRPFF